MPSLVFWDNKKRNLEQAVEDDALKEMHDSVNGSNYSGVLDCLGAADAVAEVTGMFLGSALKRGDQYIDLTEEGGSDLLHSGSFDCPSELFDHRDSDDIVKIYKKAEH